MKSLSVAGQDECVAKIQIHFNECKRERESGIKRISDRHMFNEFRIGYTHLKSGRERRHFVHYIREIGVWERTERNTGVSI